MTSGAIHGTQPAVIVAADAQIMKCVGSLETVFVFRHVTLPASLRPLPLSFNIMMAVLASIPVAHRRGMLLVIKEDLPCLALEHNPDGFVRRPERQSRISQDADQQEDHGKAVSQFKFVFSLHFFFLL
jgi:hypothetical protein